MTVSVKRNKVQYTGDNSTTAFSVTFPYTEKSQVKVYLGSTLQTITTHYTLTDPGATGTVTFLTPPGTGVNVSLIRETDYLQGVDYVNNDALDAETLEKAFDKLTMMCQQLDNKIDGAVGFDETVAGTTSLKLASDATDLAGKLLAFDDSGNFVTTQEIGTFRGTDSTTTTAAYVVRDLIRDSSNDNVYFTKVDAPSGTLLTNTSYFELLVDVATVRTLKVAAETARTGAETAETNAAASLASFQGQYKSAATNPYGGAEDEGDLWYDETNNILKYYNGTSFEPVTTSLASVADNYLTISNQVITAGTVPISLGGTSATTASGARTALGLGTASTSATGDFEASGAVSTHAALTSSVHGISSFGATLVDDADAATARTTLGLGSAATTASTDYATAAQGGTADSALQDVADDTTPQLGGNLDVNGNSIVSVSAGNISITPDTTGKIILDGLSWPTSDGSNGYCLITDGAGNLSWINKNAGSTQSVTIIPDDEFNLVTNTTNADGATEYTFELSLNAANTRTHLGLGSLATQSTITESQISDLGSYLTAETNDLGSAVTGTLGTANGGTGLTSIGTAGQVLKVNSGATALEFADESGGLTDVVSDSTPQLGGNLDVNGNSIVSASAGNIAITPDTTGKIILDGLSWPTADGSNGYCLITDGAGNLSWVNKNSGAVSSITITPADEFTVVATTSTVDGVDQYTFELSLNAANTRTHLGLGSLATQSTITESQISDLQTYLTASSTATLTNKSGNISQWTNDAGYLTTETNNLSTVSGTLGTANGGTGLTAIGTAGQVLKVNSGATALEFADESGGGGSGSSYIEHSATVSDSLAISAGTNRMYIGNTTFSGTFSGTMAGYLVVSHGYANFTSASALNITGTLKVVG